MPASRPVVTNGDIVRQRQVILNGRRAFKRDVVIHRDVVRERWAVDIFIGTRETEERLDAWWRERAKECVHEVETEADEDTSPHLTK